MDNSTFQQIFGSVFVLILLAILAYVYLNREKYIQQTQESRMILRFLSSLMSAGSSTLFINGTFNAEGEVGAFTVSLAGGIGLFVYINERWNKWDTQLNTEVTEKLISEGIEDDLVQRLSQKLEISKGGEQFSDHSQANDLKKALHKLAIDASSRQPLAMKFLLKIDKNPSIKTLLNYYQEKDSKKQNSSTEIDLVHLANLLFALKKMDETLLIADRILLSNIDNLDAIELKIMCLEHKGKEMDALPLMQKLVEKLKNVDVEGTDKKLAHYLGFLAHLIGGEAGKIYWNDTFDVADRLGNLELKAEALLNLEGREKEAVALLDFLDDVAIKASINRYLGDCCLSDYAKLEEKTKEDPLLQKAFAYFSAALKIDKKLEDYQGIADSLKGMSKYYVILEKYTTARSNALEALDMAKKSMCWKSISSKFLNLADIGRATGNYSEWKKWTLEAEKFCSTIGNEEGLAIIQQYTDSIDTEVLLKSGGIMDEEGELQTELLEATMEIFENFPQEELLERKRAFEYRNEIFSYIKVPESKEIGLGREEAEDHFHNLGFSEEDILEVDLAKTNVFFDEMHENMQGIEPVNFYEMMRMRQGLMNIIEIKTDELTSKTFNDERAEIECNSDLYYNIGRFLRMGFDLGNPAIFNYLEFKTEQSLCLMRLDGQNDEAHLGSDLEQALHQWSIGFAMFKNGNEQSNSSDFGFKILMVLGAVDLENEEVSLNDVTRITVDSATESMKIITGWETSLVK
jgi:hypothetical protein